MKEKLIISLKRIMAISIRLFIFLDLGLIWCWILPQILWVNIFKFNDIPVGDGTLALLLWVLQIIPGSVGFGWLIYGLYKWVDWLGNYTISAFNDKIFDYLWKHNIKEV